MSQYSQNPYEPPSVQSRRPGSRESADLTGVDWLIVILCSGIGVILGIVRLIQGKPSAGKMLGFSLLFVVIWGTIRVVLTMMAHAQH